jgi:hypothetical protein
VKEEEYKALDRKMANGDQFEQQRQGVFLKVESWSWNTHEPLHQRTWTTGWIAPDGEWSAHPVTTTLAAAMSYLEYIFEDGDLDPDWRWTIETEHFNS